MGQRDIPGSLSVTSHFWVRGTFLAACQPRHVFWSEGNIGSPPCWAPQAWSEAWDIYNSRTGHRPTVHSRPVFDWYPLDHPTASSGAGITKERFFRDTLYIVINFIEFIWFSSHPHYMPFALMLRQQGRLLTWVCSDIWGYVCLFVADNGASSWNRK